MPILHLPTSEPKSPVTGDMYLDMDIGIIKVFINDRWLALEEKPVIGWKKGMMPIPSPHYHRFDLEDDNG